TKSDCATTALLPRMFTRHSPRKIVGVSSPFMSNFYLDVISPDPRFESLKRIDDPSLIEPITRAAVQAIIDDARALGTELMIFETYRSQQRQEALFNQGASKLKTVGVHHFGLACDLVKVAAGEPSWKGDFSFLGTLAREHGLIWG